MTDMILAIVKRGRARDLMKAAREAGAGGGTVNYARGTAPSTILAALGIADSRREVLRIFADQDESRRIADRMAKIGIKGSLAICGKEEGMENWTLVEVICEEGFGEEVMAVARKAGATGGTVVSAHGTSTEDDVKFFGSPLVPEKEIVMMVLENDVASAVVQAVEGLDVLKQKGRAVLFTLPVKHFVNLA